MTPLRAGMLSVLLLLAVTFAWLWSSHSSDPELLQAAFTQHTLPDSYAELEQALDDDDTAALQALAHADDSYRAYLSAMYLASYEDAPAATRLAALERGLALRME